jgi:hypothetical protein
MICHRGTAEAVPGIASVTEFRHGWLTQEPARTPINMEPATLYPSQRAHLLKRNPDGTFRGGSLAEGDAGSLTRAMSSAAAQVSAYHPYQDSSEYLWNNTDRRVTPTAEVMSAARMWAADLVAIVPDEWLPEVYTDEEAEEEDEGLITTLNQLNDAQTSRGQCLHVSEAIEVYLRVALSADERPYACKVVQGMPAPHTQLNCHYALLVTMQEGDTPVMVDFTYAQVDDTAPFPLVVSAADWEQRMLAALG